MALFLIPALAGGCENGSSARSDDLSRTSGGALSDAESMIEDVEARALVGPRAARDLGYRVDWQAPGSGHRLKLIVEEGDSVFALDERNFLTRLRREDGQRVWRIPVAKPIDEILGVTYVPIIERVYVTLGGSILVLDSATGSQVGRQYLEKIANTGPVIAGQFMLYGSRNGQLVWHAYDIGYPWRAYEISPSIKLMPDARNGLVISIGNNGRIMALRIDSATQVWDKRLLDGVVAPAVVSDQAVFVASLDQHVWALDLGSGRNIWRYLTESPLTESPVLIDDRLLQQIPGEGLVCFNALPIEAPGGQVLWRAGDVAGNAVVQVQGTLLVWEAGGREMTVVDPAGGAVIRRIALAKVDRLVRTSPRSRVLIAASADGQLVRLVPTG
ncbi:MAG: outer membrane protein assembly factor BamB family protein [Planctomycetota bacterium]|jgi:outer membrane protein assembly factor BamB